MEAAEEFECAIDEMNRARHWRNALDAQTLTVNIATLTALPECVERGDTTCDWALCYRRLWQMVIRKRSRRRAAIAGAGYSGIWTVQATGRGSFLLDPLMALAVAANVTEEIELGTAILQVPLYGVVDLAHRLLSLEMVAGDRIRLGVGAGSTQTDFDAYQRDYEARFGAFRRSMAELRELLTTGRSTRLGVDLSYRPRAPIPLMLGSWGKGAVTAANEYDG